MSSVAVGICLRFWRAPHLSITPKACMESATCCGLESRRRSVWNHHEVMYGINPKEKYMLARDTIRLRQCHTRSREIPYQSFGLDRKKQVFRLAFFCVWRLIWLLLFYSKLSFSILTTQLKRSGQSCQYLFWTLPVKDLSNIVRIPKRSSFWGRSLWGELQTINKGLLRILALVLSPHKHSLVDHTRSGLSTSIHLNCPRKLNRTE